MCLFGSIVQVRRNSTLSIDAAPAPAVPEKLTKERNEGFTSSSRGLVLYGIEAFIFLKLSICSNG